MPQKLDNMRTQKNNFIKAIEFALSNQSGFVENKPSGKTNPYYIGFGNPESDIIMFGQEKAIASNNVEQIWLESNQNPNQWKRFLSGEIKEKHQRFFPQTKTHYQNPLRPYCYYPKGGTWKNYQNIISSVYPDLHREDHEATFLDQSFISEVNSAVAKIQLGKQVENERAEFLNKDFFKEFPVTILAIGNYLKPDQIENWLNVNSENGHSHPYRKLLVYKSSDKKRLVLHTRQMSRLTMNIDKREQYFGTIKKLITEHLK